MIKICVICEKPFDAKDTQHVSCGRSCAGRLARRTQVTHNSGKVKTCRVVGCGIIFIAINNGAQTCSKEHGKLIADQGRKEWHSAQPRKGVLFHRECRVCSGHFSTRLHQKKNCGPECSRVFILQQMRANYYLKKQETPGKQRLEKEQKQHLRKQKRHLEKQRLEEERSAFSLFKLMNSFEEHYENFKTDGSREADAHSTEGAPTG